MQFIKLNLNNRSSNCANVQYNLQFLKLNPTVLLSAKLLENSPDGVKRDRYGPVTRDCSVYFQ